MQTILWFAGVLAVWTGLKFVFMVFKRLGSKNSMNNLIDRMEDSMADAADTVAGYCEKRKRRKRDEERPVVTIR
jgi:hypothetical protein